MNRRPWMLLVLVGLAAALQAENPPGSAPEWAYAGPAGPEHWAELDPAWRACAGRNQSPVDLTSRIEADLPPFELAYGEGGRRILNNGHTAQIEFPAGSRLHLEGVWFELRQVHFHAPSENRIEGRSFPMEGHLVHADSLGNLAVVAVMFVEGDENRSIAAAWSAEKPIPAAGSQRELDRPLEATGLLPPRHDYYRFNGSLTTPPCSEGVRWLVLKETVAASKAQIDAFRDALGQPNNRPVQPTYARTILE